jgi:hypothetical protein
VRHRWLVNVALAVALWAVALGVAYGVWKLVTS